MSLQNPRSYLHSLAPVGMGTPDVESLLSYLCRLANSHATSTLELSKLIMAQSGIEVHKGYDWHERKISGMRASSEVWASSLSELTSIPDLDYLTFLPWRHVISQNGLAIEPHGKFCPECFTEDQNSGQPPYFRLAWEAVEYSVCHEHKTRLSTACPDCGKANVRHARAFVVPGWCVNCGFFLGTRDEKSIQDDRPNPEDWWRSLQIADLVSQSPSRTAASRERMLISIEHIITEMFAGMPSLFAQRLNIGKSTVHHWLKSGGTPTLEVSLRIAQQTGLSLRRLFNGDVDGWRVPEPGRQLSLRLELPLRTERSKPREIDWAMVEEELRRMLRDPNPISVSEAAIRLGVDPRQLYLRANETTRKLGARWKQFLASKRDANLMRAWPVLVNAARELVAQGKAVTRREVSEIVPKEILNSLEGLWAILREVEAEVLYAT